MTQNRKMTPADLRAAAEAEVAPLGEKRRKAVAALAEIDAELLPVLRSALDAEVPIRRIADLTGLAYNTIRARGKRAGTDG